MALFTLLVVPRSSAGYRVRGGAAVVDGDRQVQIEEPVLVQQATANSWKLPPNGQVATAPVLVGDLVAVGVVQVGQFVLLRDVELAVDVLDAHRLFQTGGDLLSRHASGPVAPVTLLSR